MTRFEFICEILSFFRDGFLTPIQCAAFIDSVYKVSLSDYTEMHAELKCRFIDSKS